MYNDLEIKKNKLRIDLNYLSSSSLDINNFIKAIDNSIIRGALLKAQILIISAFKDLIFQLYYLLNKFIYSNLLSVYTKQVSEFLFNYQAFIMQYNVLPILINCINNPF